MYPPKFLKISKLTLGYEGGYSNHPNDRGGPTNYGITQRTYNIYRRSVGKRLKNVKYISKHEVYDCYYKLYYVKGKCNDMLMPIAIVHFDTVVNFGITGGAKLLQKTLKVPIDGIIGPKTLKKCNSGNIVKKAILYCEIRKKMRYVLVKRRPKNKDFLKGWLRRDESLKRIIERNF